MPFSKEKASELNFKVVHHLSDWIPILVELSVFVKNVLC